MGAEPPVDALRAAEKTCGDLHTTTSVVHRRGSRVWRLDGTLGAAALKVGYATAERRDAQLMPAREAAVCRAMGGPAADHVLDAGYDGAGSWALVHWYDGPTTGRMWKPIREGSTASADRRHALEAAADYADLLAWMHQSGWMHGDVQTSHCIHTHGGARLLDYALASGPSGAIPAAVDLPYRGAMVHLTAPEIAAALATEEEPVLTPAADVYAFAASVWTASTGDWPLDYAAVGIHDYMNTPIGQLWRVIGSGTLPLTQLQPWPQLQKMLATVMCSNPSQRPTAAELSTRLRDLVTTKMNDV